ncbi:cysteine hydrolase family protein [Lysobacter solisilvae (ex Woo and Kim 2020)]|uniref:Cysteine hydrolase n=1 Tax=Agrilutibacter terrestris TaxID=2865112 RepID=A0A7H0G054_9GAMM|nr:cysteine hydrolase family protein [Lysobacter terrestris]QNP41670.1 cysteine hydrolase [Lysobacter terrestris]
MPLVLDARTALIPIDMQRGFDLDPARSNNPAIEANGRRLLSAWRAAGLPLIHVRHDSVKPGSVFAPGQPGNALRPGFEPQGSEPLVTKSVNAAFIGTDLDLRLRRLGVEQVVLFGLVTDMCVSTTARVAANLGYRTVVVGDACACFALPDADGRLIAAEEIHRAHLATLRAEFARVVDTADVLAVLGARGHAEAAAA